MLSMYAEQLPLWCVGRGPHACSTVSCELRRPSLGGGALAKSVRVLSPCFLEASMPVERMDPKRSDYVGLVKRTWAIFLISVLGLFLEMLLIHWIGTEIRIFAYLPHIMLIVCFLDLGLGCFTNRQSIRLRQMLIPLCILTLVLAMPFSRKGLGAISEFLSVIGDLVIWYSVPSQNLVRCLRTWCLDWVWRI
jgi:hypothetical protein